MNLTDERVSEIIQSFALAALDPSQWLPAMAKLSDSIGAVCCALELTDLNTGVAVMENSVGLDEQLLRDYEERVFHINPRVRNAMPLAVGAIADDRHVMDMDDPNAPEFVDWLEKTPYYYLKGGKILHSNGHVGFFTGHYAKSKGFPGDDQDRIFNHLVPHLVNFVEVGRSLNDNRLRNTLVNQESLDLERPFALLDRSGRLVECSVGFEAILRSRQVLGLRDHTLVAIHARHRHLVDGFVQSALGARRLLDQPLPVRLVTPESPRGIILRAIPLSNQHDVFDIFRPAALITITDLDKPFRVRRQELVALFGLTQREADVAALVSEGHTPERAAQELAISEYTVRQHLKTVFGKIGVSRQAELVAIVSRLAWATSE